MVNKVINFLSIFPNILLKISASVYTHTHFKHALHVRAIYFLENEQTIHVAVEF